MDAPIIEGLIFIALLSLISSYPPIIIWTIKRSNAFQGVKTEITKETIGFRQSMGIAIFLFCLGLIGYLFYISN